ncbi:MAG: tRNA (adenosine(37)-N6)-dimethylallyltransferase MiaA [Thermoflexaceae bacterium]|nr:tRNA (adenosine(37)-N6)-dimethylallyltransferase MiaA [Thermoflexaceae bacterium]
MMNKQPLIIITGPTAVGKTENSIKIAKAVNGEIISADSMQVYRHMDIGTAKITQEEMDGVPHHLIDCLEPVEDFNIFRFKQMADAAIRDIAGRGRMPVIVGGTGFYIQAVLKGVEFADEEADGSIRKELQDMAALKGNEYVHEMLRKIDPESADAIHANNLKRVIRAIEYYRLTGEKISVHNARESEKESLYDSLYFVINNDREILYQRIEERIDRMLSDGLVKEVEKLKEMGCTKDMVSMKGLGYKEILSYLNGEISYDEAVYILKRDTRHFAKRQITWFKREKDVIWMNYPDYHQDKQEMLQAMLKKIGEHYGIKYDV